MTAKTATTLLISGFALGLATGILCAPDEGKATRKKIKKEAKRLNKMASRKADDIKHTYSDVKDKVTDIKDSIESSAHNLKKRFS